MKHVTILAIENTLTTTVFGPMDVFSQAGMLWNMISLQKPEPLFHTRIATLDGQPVQAMNQVQIVPHQSVSDIHHTDLIIIPSIVVPPRGFKPFEPHIKWLKQKHREGAAIASVCTGAFLLAATGLLDGKTATTHWGFGDLFRKLFPKVLLKPERLITDEGNLYCAGALGAGIDLSIYLLEKWCGREIALQCSKSLVHDINRNLQSPYQVLQFHKNHTDEQILNTQKWIENHYHEPVSIDRISKEHAMSRRTFERRFKKATGDTPLNYLQRIRVEKAKRLLESGKQSFTDICHAVGYEDSSHFRVIFKKHTGLLPASYQKKFST